MLCIGLLTASELFSGIDAGEMSALLGAVLALLVAAVYALGPRFGLRRLPGWIRTAIAVCAVGNALFVVFLWVNHLPFPLILEELEAVILQHVQRLAGGQFLYVDLSSDFVPLVYTPLYYVLAAPFTALLGMSLPTLRFVSILGIIGAGAVLYLVVRRRTGSTWHGLVAVGLFGAAYRVMDCYLDPAHPDSWMLFLVLLGSYLIDLRRSKGLNVLGLGLIVLGFWFKQYAAMFVLIALLYLTWREGWRRSWGYWLVALLLGPGLYFFAGPLLFGPRFVYYTLTVAARWAQFDWNLTVLRLLKFSVKSWFWLAIVAGIAAYLELRRSGRQSSIWHFALPFAVLGSFYLALDPGRDNNLFIPMGVWFIITGLLGLKALAGLYPVLELRGAHVFVLLASFALLQYNGAEVIVSNRAAASYDDLVRMLRSLDGPVYAPLIGQLQGEYQFQPRVHWVPMVDLFRGGKLHEDTWDLDNQPLTRELLEPILHSTGNSYILTSVRIEDDLALGFLKDTYLLESDLEDRFQPLMTLPKLVGQSYPRFLYRHEGQEATHPSRSDGPAPGR